jgi:Ankyrin repeats (3 copies)/Ankyrin repeats (many copies)
VSEGQDAGEVDRAQCAVHGLHFDPRTHSGCVLCRRSEVGAAPAPRRASPWLWGGALGALWLLAAGIGVVAMRTSTRTPPDAPPTVARATATTPAPTIAHADAGASEAAGAPTSGDQPASDDHGRTALMRAAESGDRAATDRLLTAGAPLNAVDERGWTALMYASAGSHFEIVRVLLARGASLEVRCERGMTALSHAASAGPRDTTVPTLAALLGAGAEIDARDARGATPLMLAAAAGDVAATSTLHERGASLDARDSRGHSALDYVVAPRTSLAPQALAALRSTLRILLNRGIDRRLGTNTAWVPILLRDELDATLRKEGRPMLPVYAPDAAPAPTRASALDAPSTEVSFASVQVWPAVGWQRAWLIPDTLSGILAAFRSLPRAPGVLTRAELGAFSLPSAQRVGLASDREGRRAWSAHDALLFEVYRGPVRSRTAFAGRVESLVLDGRPVARLGPQQFSIGPTELDLTDLFTSGGDRLVISVLNVLGWGACSSLYVTLRGPGVETTITRFTVKR